MGTLVGGPGKAMPRGYASSTASGFAMPKTLKPRPKPEDMRPLFLYWADVTEASLAQIASAESRRHVAREGRVLQVTFALGALKPGSGSGLGTWRSAS
ncbi:hypothetical protein AK812_SmicGene17111 [Symbiodinium microadriaticum]|uniref:Uncharacterized protein n=1 Tax=Symbiodinium microadriaticum TaxID=2951 RepID=A0A1Q9DYP4_SYMMI|nr:hypothetical protein AK812_SmicGene17111 [Symbiodinium microadriaticum]